MPAIRAFAAYGVRKMSLLYFANIEISALGSHQWHFEYPKSDTGKNQTTRKL